jgi:hypothetical protein
VVKRAKAAKRAKRARKERLSDVGACSGVSDSRAVEDGEDGIGGGDELGAAGRMKRSEFPLLSLVGSGKPWSFQAVSHGEARDRGVAPPALPIPIASFTI